MTTDPTTTATTRPEAPARRRSPWPYAIAGLLAAHVGAMALAVHIAGGSSGDTLLPEYYDRAVAWDELRAAAERSAALGWSLAIAPATLCDVAGERRVTFELRDSAGDPVDGATVTVRVYHRAIGERHAAEAAPLGRGLYEATLPLVDAGEHEFDTTATLDGLEFRDARTVHIAALGASPTRPEGGSSQR